MKKFENNEQAIIVNTNSDMDGVLVTVTGITYSTVGTAFYIIERCNGMIWHNGYRSLELISSCLCEVPQT